MAPDEDLLGFEDDYVEEADSDEVLFGLVDEAKKEKKKKKGKKLDELDEVAVNAEDPEEDDIYANEDFESYNPGVGD